MQQRQQQQQAYWQAVWQNRLPIHDHGEHQEEDNIENLVDSEDEIFDSSHPVGEPLSRRSTLREIASVVLALFCLCITFSTTFRQQSQDTDPFKGKGRSLVNLPAADDADDVCHVGADSIDYDLQSKVLRYALGGAPIKNKEGWR